MQCEFCEERLPQNEPENIALLQHVGRNRGCNEQYRYALENTRSSWTVNMSGG